MSQQAFGSESVEWVMLCPALTMPAHDVDNLDQRLECGNFAMQHLERLAVVSPNTDLETRSVVIAIDNDSAHFKTHDFAAQHTMLAHNIGTRFANH